MNNRKTIQRYITLLMGFFSLIGLGFLWVAYLYQGSAITPQSGGQITVAQLASPPLLSPLAYGTDDRTSILNQLMFRSIMKPDPKTQELTPDLGSCEFGRVAGEVSCSVSLGSTFSDGTPITREDVLQSFVLYREQARSAHILEILSRTSISEGASGNIVFRNANRPKEIAELLVMPILPNAKLESIKVGMISDDTPVSGAMKYVRRETNEATGVSRIFFEKNPSYASKFLSNKMVFAFYGDNSEVFVREAPQATYIYPSSSVGMGGVNRDNFEAITLEIPEVLGLFPNTKTLPPLFRGALHSTIDALRQDQSSLFGDRFPQIFGSQTLSGSLSMSGAQQKLRSALAESGKFPKKDVLATLQDRLALLQTQSGVINTNPGYNNFITSPGKEKQFISSGAFVLRGDIPTGATSVSINGFRLTEFNGKTFAYRANKDIGTLKNGINTYNVVFYRGAKVLSQETIQVDLVTDSVVFEEKSRSLFEVYHPEIAQARREKQIQDLQETMNKISSTPDTIFVNERGEKATFRITTLTQEADTPALIRSLTALLEAAGMEVVVNEAGLEDIRTAVKNDDRSYDLLLAGIYIGRDGKDAFSFFHSRGISSGFNFGAVSDSVVDVSLSELKELNSDLPRFATLTQRIADRLFQESYFYPIDMRSQNLFVSREALLKSGFQTLSQDRFVNLSDLGEYFPLTAKNVLYVRPSSPKTLQGFIDFIGGLF